MSTRPFHDIPFVEPSDEMAADPARAIAERYARHGAIFRTTTPFGHDLVYLVGPEANRFVLATERLKFSHRVGWGELLGVIEVYGDGLLTMDGQRHDEHHSGGHRAGCEQLQCSGLPGPSGPRHNRPFIYGETGPAFRQRQTWIGRICDCAGQPAWLPAPLDRRHG
jgi:hypothetical protein